MEKPHRIFIIEDIKQYSGKFLLSGIRKQAKGFVRLGHDVHRFDYGGAFWQIAPVKSTILSRRSCKPQVDELLEKQLKRYEPDIVQVSFANFIDTDTIDIIRKAAPNAFLYGFDGDPWPQYQKNRLQIGAKLDLVMATNNGKWLQEYRQTGVKSCFMPNPCDPDIDRRYQVDEKWKSSILFTGKTRKSQKRYPSDQSRHKIIEHLAQMENSAVYGCLGRPAVDGIQYLYAVSGAEMALSINIINNVSMYHSDRLTHYLACGTFVLAKRVPDSDMLFRDGQCLRYFDTLEEFCELVQWYRKNENQRRQIADTGMQYVHEHFSGLKIAQYTLDLIEKGTYSAPWGCFS